MGGLSQVTWAWIGRSGGRIQLGVGYGLGKGWGMGWTMMMVDRGGSATSTSFWTSSHALLSVRHHPTRAVMAHCTLLRLRAFRVLLGA